MKNINKKINLINMIKFVNHLLLVTNFYSPKMLIGSRLYMQFNV